MSNWDDEAIAAFVVTLCEPLMPLTAVVGIHARAADIFTDNAARASIWAGGTLHDVVQSLPGIDPWRSPAEGFGTWHDGTDLLVVAHRNLFTDVGLAALAQPLGAPARDLMAAATLGLDQAIEAAASIDPEDLFDTATAVLRWAAWRRRVYTGPEDPFFMLTGFEWLDRSEKISTGQPWARQPWENARRAAQISDDEYDPVTRPAVDLAWADSSITASAGSPPEPPKPGSLADEDADTARHGAGPKTL